MRQADSRTGFKLAVHEIRPKNPDFRKIVRNGPAIRNCPITCPEARAMGPQFPASPHNLEID